MRSKQENDHDQNSRMILMDCFNTFRGSISKGSRTKLLFPNGNIFVFSYSLGNLNSRPYITEVEKTELGASLNCGWNGEEASAGRVGSCGSPFFNEFIVVLYYLVHNLR